jgi:hypothetical protein
VLVAQCDTVEVELTKTRLGTKAEAVAGTPSK